MDDLELLHNVTFNHYTQSGKDGYGQPVRSQSVVNEKCFYDLPKTQKIIRVERSEINVDAVLYMKKDSPIAIDDVVTLVTDSEGTTISSITLRVARVTRASDFGTVHHLEVDLQKA